MSRALLRIAMILTVICPCFSQSAGEIVLDLSTARNQKVFRIGETIEIEFRFSSSVPNKYEVHETYPRIRIYYRSPIRFVSEPSAGVVDPLGDYVYESSPVISGAPPKVWPLTAQPVVIKHTLNDWLFFQKPGRYRIFAETLTVTRAGQGQVFEIRNPIPVRSEVLDIELVAPEAGWAEAQLRAATETLERAIVQRSTFPARSPQGGAIAGSSFVDTEGPSSVLRYLGTPGAARALVHFLDSVPHAHIQDGLWASPNRQEVIRAMEARIDDPDFAVGDYWLGRLTFLAAGRAIGPRGTGSPQQSDAEWLRRLQSEWKTQAARYMSMLEKALPKKRGQAREPSLKTLSGLQQAVARD